MWLKYLPQHHHPCGLERESLFVQVWSFSPGLGKGGFSGFSQGERRTGNMAGAYRFFFSKVRNQFMIFFRVEWFNCVRGRHLPAFRLTGRSPAGPSCGVISI